MCKKCCLLRNVCWVVMKMSAVVSLQQWGKLRSAEGVTNVSKTSGQAYRACGINAVDEGIDRAKEGNCPRSIRVWWMQEG